MKRIVSPLLLVLTSGWAAGPLFAEVPLAQLAMTLPAARPAARTVVPQAPGRILPAPTELERHIQATADFEAVVDAERGLDSSAPGPMPAAAPAGPRRVRVSGLLMDGRRNRMKGVYLLFFRFLDQEGRTLGSARSSMYVPVEDGVFKATLELPEDASQYRVIAEAPKGTNWLVKPRPYYVQAGSFEEPARAESLRAGLSIRFNRAFITEDVVEGVRMHQVRVGPFDRKAEAEEAASWLEAAGTESLVLRGDPRAQQP